MTEPGGDGDIGADGAVTPSDGISAGGRRESLHKQDGGSSKDGKGSSSPPSGGHEAVDFAPADLTDGRPRHQWGSRYSARRCAVQIGGEALYLFVMLAIAGGALLLIWQGAWMRDLLEVNARRYETFSLYAYAWTAGLLGGTLFAIKWLYHSVAHGVWNVDRLAWRLFTPHLSGALSFALVALITSDLFDVLNRDLLRTSPTVVGVGFLFGYFSDFTVARLYRIAQNLLGDERDAPERAT